MKKTQILVIASIAIVLTFGLIGCDSDDDNNSSTEPGFTIAFTPDTYSPPDNSVYIDFVSSSGTELVFDIKAKKVTDVYGVAFALHFDQSIFNYVASSEGDFFDSAGGNTTYLAITGTNVVTVGISLMGSETVPVSGSGTLCRMIFEPVEAGQSHFNYRENRLLDNAGQERPDVQWFGGLGIVVN